MIFWEYFVCLIMSNKLFKKIKEKEIKNKRPYLEVRSLKYNINIDSYFKICYTYSCGKTNGQAHIIMDTTDLLYDHFKELKNALYYFSYQHIFVRGVKFQEYHKNLKYITNIAILNLLYKEVDLFD